MISAVMPTTTRRRAWLPLAVQCWQAQTYLDRELIVVGDAALAAWLPDDPRIRLVVAADDAPVGTKRDLGNEHAHGEYLAHWDDDDWSAPWRLEEQLAALQRVNGELSGERTLPFFDVPTAEWWQYTYPVETAGAVGTTLFYTRALWQTRPFGPHAYGEDIRWCLAHHAVIAPPARPICIASSHRFNTCARRYVPPAWHLLTAAARAALPPEAAPWIVAAAAAARYVPGS